MQRKTVITLASVAAAVVVLGGAAAVFGPGIYRDSIAAPASAAPTIAAPAEGAALTDLDGTWTVGEGSFAGYRVDEVLNGADVTVTGRTDQVTGEVVAAGGEISSASFEVDVASIATDNDSRDDYFRTQALQSDEFPTATFVLTEPITDLGTLAETGTATSTVRGELTIHGVTQPVEAEVQTAVDGDGVQLAGAVPITFADYGVEAPSLGFVQVEPTGAVEFQLALGRAA